ncbi:hypothetical protein [Chryseobacterium indoltheticum]|uniref:Uncharacterized protein n=1 Tax=Chryseobacterium indoltheticum TaxID=254 RepID=A0A381FIJ8_9FLAO|nr:hypothetical protein [Chryseobacterium indoltheticum]AZA74760.1 hypothetical protein EG358_13740 [Chryseobacterium indoltheticum]SIQ36309.1 hypothetical protein SAMN05421682_104222 [Chryseobacterium indoltheticum]SUX45972.1 Uncharacterised protein [Chryseobacterium indoltheticum]
MLKSCDDLTQEVFALQVLNFINPNLENPDFDDPNSDGSLNKQKIKDFAKKSRLTPQEFLDALDLVPRDELTTIEQRPNGEDFEKPLKLFSRIDSKNLIEIETAYIRYRSKNKLYEKGKAELKAFLMPPVQESTQEQKEAQNRKFLKEEYQRLQIRGFVLGTTIFYDMLRPNYKVVNIAFIEIFLQTFKPEVFEDEIRSTEVHLANSKKIIKRDVLLAFKELFVKTYIEKAQLKSLSESEWIEHWKNIKNNT